MIAFISREFVVLSDVEASTDWRRGADHLNSQCEMGSEMNPDQ
jgi:hypothetical protein